MSSLSSHNSLQPVYSCTVYSRYIFVLLSAVCKFEFCVVYLPFVHLCFNETELPVHLSQFCHLACCFLQSFCCYLLVLTELVWLFPYLSVLTDLLMACHFSGGPGLTSTRMSAFWTWLELRMLKEVVTTGAIRHAKLQSNRHHQQTNSSTLTLLVGRQKGIWPVKKLCVGATFVYNNCKTIDV